MDHSEAKLAKDASTEAPLGEAVIPRPDAATRRDAQTARILDAARQCFIKSGFQGASMQEICATAQMSPGALYRYFPSKDAIVLAICEQHRQEDAEILMSMQQNPDVIEGAVNAVMEHIRHVHESGFASIFSEIRASSHRNPALGEACDAAMLQARDSFYAYFSAAISKGTIQPIVPLDALLDIMLAMGDGLVANDLPSKGIDTKHIQTVMRASLLACIQRSENHIQLELAQSPSPAIKNEAPQ